MVSCVFPGSFDPVTKGHADLIFRAARLFDHVTVAILVNIRKSGCIRIEKRAELLLKACNGLPNVSVECWSGLLADYMKEKGEKIVLRGLRSSAEAEQEIMSSAINKILNEDIETFFLPTNPAYSGISSSAVREIVAFGGDIRSLVPEGLAEEIKSVLSK